MNIRVRRAPAMFPHAGYRAERYDHVLRRGEEDSLRRQCLTRGRKVEVRRLLVGVCQLEASSGQRLAGVTTMPTPGTGTR